MVPEVIYHPLKSFINLDGRFNGENNPFHMFSVLAALQVPIILWGRLGSLGWGETTRMQRGWVLHRWWAGVPELRRIFRFQVQWLWPLRPLLAISTSVTISEAPNFFYFYRGEDGSLGALFPPSPTTTFSSFLVSPTHSWNSSFFSVTPTQRSNLCIMARHWK